MEYTRVFGSAEVSRITGLSGRQLINLAEKRIVRPMVDAEGLGTRRIYDSVNMLQFLVIKAFLDIGIGLPRIKKLLKKLTRQDFYVPWGEKWEQGILALVLKKTAFDSENQLRVAVFEDASESEVLAIIKETEGMQLMAVLMISLRRLKLQFQNADGMLAHTVSSEDG